MEETVLAVTDFGIKNNEAIPLIYFLGISDNRIPMDPFDNQPPFKKGFHFAIASVHSGIVFFFKNSKKHLRLSVDRNQITNYERLGYGNFEAKKTSSLAGSLRLAGQAVPGARAIFPSMLINNVSNWLTGNKSEIHHGQIFNLNYESDGLRKIIKIACEPIYENEFIHFLNIHWVNQLR